MKDRLRREGLLGAFLLTLSVQSNAVTARIITIPPPGSQCETLASSIAQISGHDRDFGTLEAGKRPDIFLLRTNPLKDVRALERPAAMVAAGRHYPRATVNDFLGARPEGEMASAY